VGGSGTVFSLAADNKVCLHTASLSPKYREDNWQDFAMHPVSKTVVKHNRPSALVYDWWIARWGGANPLGFCGSPNINSYSFAIDVVPGPDGTYTDAQYVAVKQLVAEARAKYTIQHVLGHADVDPMRRGIVLNASGALVGKDWDPGIFDWKRVR
jgi:hypothetical protein